MPPSEPSKLLKSIDKKLTRIEQAFFGIEGTEDNGMLGEFNTLRNSHYTLRTRFYILVAFLIGSGLLGGGIWWLSGG